jgi:glycosyltransferase involved in cell wall biosynthesis
MTSPAVDGEIRVLYLIGGRRVGGMERHLISLASRLPRTVRCLVCCLEPSADYEARLADAGIEHTNLDWPVLLRPGGMLAYLRLERAVRRFRPHIVHSYGFVADVVAGLLRASGSNVRIVTSRRGEDANRRHQAFRRLVNRLSNTVVCVSHETAAFVESTESPRPGLLTVIPNGVAVDATVSHGRLRRENTTGARPEQEAPVRFGTLGTVKPIKGTDLLVDAFMQFDPTARVELLIAGLIDRPWAEALRARASRDTRIQFVGRLSDASRFLSSLDVFVLPSRSEGMSNALLEAMASGLPCIATDVGSNCSLLRPPAEPAAGLICEPNAEPLFRAMFEMASHAEARLDYGDHGRALVGRSYTIPNMVLEYERLYRTVVGRPAIQPEIAQAPCATE